MTRSGRGLRGPTGCKGRREAVALGVFGVLLVSGALVADASAATAAQEASRHPAAVSARLAPSPVRHAGRWRTGTAYTVTGAGRRP
ncbi:hypothetical protein CTZ27_20265 [Streptomyces griseocarneus]|nr:hypothetical protein CTZ27_20265 [Streptomyces griseocarneus]